MKSKLYLPVLISLIVYSASLAQTTYYIPGSGTTVKELSFEAPALLTQNFNYCNGWAGTGFGLTGTQRGAPEAVNVIANPKPVTSSGNQVLAFRSFERDAAWHAANSAGCPGSIYGGPDDNTLGGGYQDDFFMTGAGWVSADTPSVMMHVFVPDYLDGNSIVTSLRMPVKFVVAGTSYNSWPGIWCYGSFFYLRGPGRADIGQYTYAANAGKDTWWTFGVSITPDGDIQYYATPSYVTELTVDHFIGSNSVLSAQARAESSTPEDYEYYPVAQSNDAIIMSSNINMTTSLTLIDNLFYTKGTTQVLSVTENDVKSIAMYPNPTSDYLFVKGLRNTTPYKISDNLGRVIKTGNITTASNKIDVNFLSKGIYFLILDGYKTNKFVKD